MPISGLMGSSAQYPSATGVRLGLTSTKDANHKTLNLYKYNLAIKGTPGTAAEYDVQVMTFNGDWIDIPDSRLSGNGAAATGSVSGFALGYGVRLDATNGTSPGSGANTPNYELEVEAQRVIPVRV